MKCRLFTGLVILFSIVVHAQQNLAIIDSFKAQLARATTSEQKVWILGPLAMTLMNTNIAEADKYGALLNQEAELSRNRNLMVKALLMNGQRYSFFQGNKAFLQKSLDYYNKALELARKNKLEKETGEALLSVSSLYSSLGDLDKAMNFATQAFAISSNLDDDSLKVATYYSFGSVYQLKKERLLALRNYLTALRIAEESKDPLLLRSCYYALSQFYSDIKEYDKAIDYLRKASEQLPAIKNMPNKAYTSVVDLFLMGDMYMQKKDFEMSVYFYDSSIRRADELKYYPLKMPGYRGILRQFIQAKQPEKALAYLNKSDDLKKFINNMGSGYVIDNAYAAIYTQIGKYDSAGYYFAKSAPALEATSTASSKLSFYYQYADFFEKAGDKPKALEYFNRAMALADETKDLEWQQRIAKELDTVYAAIGDFKQSRVYSNLYYNYKDSIQKLGEEKDFLQMELTDEEQRQKRKEKEEAEVLRERHNIQYMGITISIAVVFLFLILMGALRVSETTIKIMGFFAFILLFEFIILIADNQIHHWTQGEPLPLLGIKIVLIAMLLPLHHWLEHKVVHYLASRRLIVPSGKSIWHFFTKKKKYHKENETGKAHH
jgi:tetratricopeptide (TPR) repeat protein